MNVDIGMPHNQLGTLAGTCSYGLDAAYHYMRWWDPTTHLLVCWFLCHMVEDRLCAFSYMCLQLPPNF